MLTTKQVNNNAWTKLLVFGDTQKALRYKQAIKLPVFPMKLIT